MINLFQIASDDKSVDYLGKLFGSMHGIIPGGSGDITILGTLFKTFNSVVLAVAALILVYVTVVGVMATANEGEFMGKKWHSLWVPIRTVLGIATLVPTGSGYSAIQIVMMWVIIQGVGAADTLWNTALSFINVAGSPFGQITVPTTGINQNLQNLYKGIVCERSALRAEANPYMGSTVGGYYCNPQSNPKRDTAFCAAGNTFNEKLNQYVMGPQSNCGSMTYCNEAAACASTPKNPKGQDSLTCLSCRAQIQSLQAIVPLMSNLADRLVNTDYIYQTYYNDRSMPMMASPTNPPQWLDEYCNANQNSGCADKNALPDPGLGRLSAPDKTVKQLYWTYAIRPSISSDATGTDSDFINTMTSFYSQALEGAITSYIQAQGSDPSSLSKDLQAAQKTGWALAGGYYYLIAQKNNDNFSEALPNFAVNVIDPATQQQNPMKAYRNNYAAATSLLSIMQAGDEGDSGADQVSAGASQAVSRAVADLNGMVAKSTTTGSNPLSQLQVAGTVMLASAAALYGILLIIALVAGLTGNISAFVLGTGVTNPAGPTWILVYFILIPGLLGFIGLLITYGALLSIYVPLIPYVIFTFGVIGWLLSTIETMVAGPLVALGILSPGGQHELLGKAEPALMLLFNVFLRPSLMILGLIAALLLSSVVVTMINEAFWTTVIKGIYGMGGTKGSAVYANPLAMILFLGAYITLIVSALNKCFAAIYIIPEQVMRWIGGQGERYGEGEAVGEVKQTVTGAAASTKGALGSVQEGTTKAGAGIEQAKGKRETGPEASKKEEK